jgi:hypothetical protein
LIPTNCQGAFRGEATDRETKNHLAGFASASVEMIDYGREFSL